MDRVGNVDFRVVQMFGLNAAEDANVIFAMQK